MPRNPLASDAKRQPKIRWSKSDIAILKREIKNFNTRLRAAERKWGEGAVFLPERETARDYKNRFKTRKEFKDYLAQLRYGRAKTFSPVEEVIGEGAEATVVLTSRYKQREEKRHRQRGIEALSRLEVITSELTQVEDSGLFPDEQTLLKRRLQRSKGDTIRERIQNVMEDIINDKRLESWRNNYINKIREAVSQHVTTHPVTQNQLNHILSTAAEIETIVRSISPEAFYIAMGLDPLTSFSFIYLTDQFIAALDRVLGEWERYEGL